MKTILVTGGAGFIGSNLCGKLLEDNDNYVICLDNLSTGRYCNIEPFIKNKNFEFIEHDITEYIDLENRNISEIYNAACPASPPAYQKSPTKTTKTCILGIINMLDLATKCNSKILQFSTSEVYGDPIIHPQTENYNGNVNPIGIRSCYDEGKRCAESICFDYRREFGTNIKVIRIFNTYGINMDPLDGRVVSNFIMQALNNEDITIYGDGEQTRSFCFIDDLIEGIIRMMNSEEEGPINLGNPSEFSVKSLANLILSLISSDSKIIYKEKPLDDPIKRKPDITTAMTKLNWVPKVSLLEGLSKTIEYFKKYIKIN